ncbi:MAG: PEP-CTERM sorting domain-containing protein [Verrucomicrobiota bacterium]
MKLVRWTTLRLFALGNALTLTSAVAQSFTATYDFAQVNTSSGTTDPTPPPSVVGVTFGSFSSTGMSANPNATVRFSFTSQPLGGVNASDDFTQFTGSLTPTAYFEVAVTPLSLVQLQLDSIAFTVQRSGTGIRSYAVRSSLDGYAANLAASISTANANLGVGPGNEFRVLLDSVTTAQNGSLVTLGTPFIGLTAPVTFRFYGWNAEGTGGTFSVDNVVFSGRTDSVPEPSATVLLLGSLAAFGFSQRRR